MNNHRAKEFSNALLSLANTLRPFLPQSGGSALSDWCSDAIKNFNEIHKEEVRAQLLAIDDVSLFYARVVGDDRWLPINLTDVDVEQETYALEKELNRFTGDVSTFMNLYFDQGYAPAIDYPYYRELRKQITKAWDDLYPNADDSVIIFAADNKCGVSYRVRLTKIHGKGWGSHEFKLLITHTAPWFIHPVTHQEYTTIDLELVANAVRSFVQNTLEVELPHLDSSMDYGLIGEDVSFVIDPSNTFNPTRVCWQDGVPHLKYHGHNNPTPINPILNPEYNYIAVLKTTDNKDKD